MNMLWTACHPGIVDGFHLQQLVITLYDLRTLRAFEWNWNRRTDAKYKQPCLVIVEIEKCSVKFAICHFRSLQ